MRKQLTSRLALTAVASALLVLTGARVTDQRYHTVDLAFSKPLGDAPVDNPQRKPRAGMPISYRLGDN